jgi:hypothetical protein
MPVALTLKNPIIRRKPFLYQDGLHLDFTRNGDAGFHYTKAVGQREQVLPFASFVTTARAGTATRVGPTGLIENVAPNVERIDYSNAAGFSGLGVLLRETASANLDIQSETIGGAGWLNVRSSALANFSLAPDGAFTASQIVEDATPLQTHFTRQDIAAVVAGTTYCQSVFARARGRRFIFIYFGNDTAAFANEGAWFDLATGRAYLVGGFTTAPLNFGIQRLPNGWFRCWLTALAGASLLCVNRIALSDDGISPAYNGDGVSGVDLWGWNFSPLAALTSYVHSVAAPVTRAADRYSGAVGAWFNNANIATLGILSQMGVAANGTNQFQFRFSDNTYNNSVSLNIAAAGSAQIASSSGGVFDGAASPAGIITNANFGLVGTLRAVNDMAAARDGGAVGIDATVTVPVALTRFDIGSDHAGANDCASVRFRRIDYLPYGVPNAQIMYASV